MAKLYKSLKSDVIAIYITEKASIHKSGKSSWFMSKDIPYAPVASLLSVNQNQITLVSAEETKRDITTVNQNTGLSYFDTKVMQTTKIDVTTNDLMVGPATFALNMTSSPVTVTPASGNPITLEPIILKSIPAVANKLVFLQVHILSVPARDTPSFELDKMHFRSMHDKLSGRQDHQSMELKALYTYVISVLDTSLFNESKVAHTSYKVATATVVSPDEIFAHEAFVGKRVDCFHLTGLNVDVTKKDMVDASLHDSILRSLQQDRDVVETFAANAVSCFVVDRHKRLGKRFFNFAGNVLEVPVLEDLAREDGFYIVKSTDAQSKLLVPLVFTPLVDIDQQKYLYVSQEQAAKGADMDQLYRDEIARERDAAQAKIVQVNTEAARQVNDIKIEAARAQAEAASANAALQRTQLLEKGALERLKQEADFALEKQKADHDRQTQLLKAELDSQLHAKKQETDLLKYSLDQMRYKMDTSTLGVKAGFEERKYERDTALETIKTVGSVAGLIAGSYVLFRKFG